MSCHTGKFLCSTYLQLVKMSREDALKAHEQFPLMDTSITMSNLLDGAYCKILLDSGATNSCMP